jgi:hypothetical protein
MDLGPISFGAGQSHDEFAAAAFACSRADLPPVSPKYAGADGEPKASAIHPTALERLEDSSQHVVRDARASVEDSYAIAACAGLAINVDGRARGSRLNGVPEQILNHLPHPHRVDREGCVFFGFHPYGAALRLPTRLKSLSRFSQEVTHVDLYARNLGCARIGDEVVGDPLASSGLFVENPEFPAKFVAFRLRNHRPQVASDDRDGIIDLVSDPSGELTDCRHSFNRDQTLLMLRQLLRHLIKRASNKPKLAIGGYGNTGTQIASADSSRCVYQSAQRAKNCRSQFARGHNR